MCAALQKCALVKKSLLGTFDGQVHDSPFEGVRPALWAPQAQWDVLETSRLLVADDKTGCVCMPCEAGDNHVSWVFVPSYNRYHAQGSKQMLIDWADAMPSDHPFVRFLVIRPIAEEEVVSCRLTYLLQAAAIMPWTTVASMLSAYGPAHRGAVQMETTHVVAAYVGAVHMVNTRVVAAYVGAVHMLNTRVVAAYVGGVHLLAVHMAQ